MALLKSDGYGHSAVEVAKALEEIPQKGLHAFAVANIEEGIQLRQHGVRGRIYVLSGIQRVDGEILRALLTCDLVPVLSSLRVLAELSKEVQLSQAKITIQLKFNTGMNRLGFDEEELGEIFKLLDTTPGIFVDGLLSHYAAAEEPRKPLTLRQTKNFSRIVAAFRAQGINPNYLHLENSAGLENHCFPEGNLSRVGLHLYGEGKKGLEPVGTWSAEIYSVRDVAKGEGIGYGPLFTTKRRSKIAILGVGYADGYRRTLSNRADVLIAGQRCRVVGAISMDLTAVDVSRLSRIPTGARAILLGKDRKQEITAVELAKHAMTIPWEILTGISTRVPRIFRR